MPITATSDGFSNYLLQRVCDRGKDWLVSITEEKEELDENSRRALRRCAWVLLLGTAQSDHLEDWCVQLDDKRKEYAKILFEVATEPSPGILDFLWTNKDDEKWLLKQAIARDVDSLPFQHDILSQAVNKALLVRFLFAWCYTFNYAEDHTVMYQQGMCELAAIVLLVVIEGEYVGEDQEQDSPGVALCGRVFNEHDAFSIFRSLMDRGIKTLFLPSCGKATKGETTTAPIFARCAAIHDALLRRNDDQIYCHLQSLGIESQFYLLRWLRCLFAREFPLHEIVQIWDAIFADGYRSVERRKREKSGWVFGGGLDETTNISLSLIQEMYADLDMPAEMLAAAASSSKALPMVDFMAVALVRSSRRRLLKCNMAGCLQILAEGDCKPQISALLKETRKSMEADLPRMDDAPLYTPSLETTTQLTKVEPPKVDVVLSDEWFDSKVAAYQEALANDGTVKPPDSMGVAELTSRELEIQLGSRVEPSVKRYISVGDSQNVFASSVRTGSDRIGLATVQRRTTLESRVSEVSSDNKAIIKSLVKEDSSNTGDVQRMTSQELFYARLASQLGDPQLPGTGTSDAESTTSQEQFYSQLARKVESDRLKNSGSDQSVNAAASDAGSMTSQERFYSQLAKTVADQFAKNIGAHEVTRMDSQEKFYSELGKKVEANYATNMGILCQDSINSADSQNCSEVRQVNSIEDTALSIDGSSVARLDCIGPDGIGNTGGSSVSQQGTVVTQSDSIEHSLPRGGSSAVEQVDCLGSVQLDTLAVSSGGNFVVVPQLTLTDTQPCASEGSHIVPTPQLSHVSVAWTPQASQLDIGQTPQLSWHAESIASYKKAVSPSDEQSMANADSQRPTIAEGAMVSDPVSDTTLGALDATLGHIVLSTRASNATPPEGYAPLSVAEPDVVNGDRQPSPVALKAVETSAASPAARVVLNAVETRARSPFGRARSAGSPLISRQRSPNRAPISIPRHYSQCRSSSPASHGTRPQGGQESLASRAREKIHNASPEAVNRRLPGLISRRAAAPLDGFRIPESTQLGNRAVSSTSPALGGAGSVIIESTGDGQDANRLHRAFTPRPATIRMASPVTISDASQNPSRRLMSLPLGRSLSPNARGASPLFVHTLQSDGAPTLVNASSTKNRLVSLPAPSARFSSRPQMASARFSTPQEAAGARSASPDRNALLSRAIGSAMDGSVVANSNSTFLRIVDPAVTNAEVPIRQAFSCRLPVRSISPPSQALRPGPCRASPHGASLSPQRLTPRLVRDTLQQPTLSHVDGESQSLELSSLVNDITRPRPLLSHAVSEPPAELLSYVSGSSVPRPLLSYIDGDLRPAQIPFIGGTIPQKSSFGDAEIRTFQFAGMSSSRRPLLSHTSPVGQLPPVCTSLRSSWRFGSGDLLDNGGKSVRLPVHKVFTEQG